MNAMTNGAVRDKGELAAEAWGVLGNVSAEEVAAWLLKERGVEVSVATIRKVKPDELKATKGSGGSGKKEGGDDIVGQVTVTQLRAVKESAGGLSGLDELLKMLDAVEAAAAKVGGTDKLRAGIVALQDLIS